MEDFDVCVYFIVGEVVELYFCLLGETTAVVAVGKGDTGDNGMRMARQAAQHTACRLGVAGLAEDFALNNHKSVGGDKHCVVGEQVRIDFALELRQGNGNFKRRCHRVTFFDDLATGRNLKLGHYKAKQLLTARRTRRQNYFSGIGCGGKNPILFFCHGILSKGR